MKKLHQSITQWISNGHSKEIDPNQLRNKIDWVRALPFILLNLSCLCVFWVGFSWTAFIAAIVLCYIRVFSIGAFYHRYFSHRAYKTNRFWQLIFAILGASAAQRGPLWWATHHRRHHVVADEPVDAHSPVHHGFFWSHIGWFLAEKNYHYNSQNVTDLTKYPELVFLDRYDVLVPVMFAAGVFGLGTFLNHFFPALGTSGCQMLVWGFSISTVILFHITVSINSIAHKYGKRHFNTKDNSRNNLFLALLTLGEGWHNNHHHFPATAQQGFKFWQIDITYYIICMLEKLGIIWDVRRVPKEVLNENLI